MDDLLLTTEQVAARLGVKPATVYAYVSRGLLASQRNADGKGSLFTKSDVDAFAAGRRRTTTPGIRTGITLIRDGELFYRGHNAVHLAYGSSFEAVANLLWTGELTETEAVPHEDRLRLARAVTAPLPRTARITDHLRVIVAASAAADPLRFDIAPASVVATGRSLLGTMVAALHGVIPTRRLPLAGQLWYRLSPRDPGEHEFQILNAALVLLADHDLAASTLAARVAASTRAHPYAVVSAGLAALDGPLHGAASGVAYELLAKAMASKDPIGTVAAQLRGGGPVPGFGHPLYPGGDPRAQALFDLIEDGPASETARQVALVVRDRSGLHPNVDMAIAALAHAYRMSADAGEAIFAVARTAGWLAHALEEYADRPSRFRPAGLYAGTQPG